MLSFSLFSSILNCNILRSNPINLGSNPDDDDGIDMVMDVALVGVFNDDLRDLFDDDFSGVEAPDIPNIFGSSPSILGSIPPGNSLGSIMAGILVDIFF